MILFDLSNIVFSTVLDFWQTTKTQPDIGMMRHLILNKLIAEKKKLSKFADEIVFCFDGAHSWRKKFAPSYKGKRALEREASDFDWTDFFKNYNQIKDEFREYFPVKCIEIESVEADDIMAILAMRYGNSKDVVIVSADKDMIQVQQVICDKVKQYSPYHGKFLKPDGKKTYDLFEHVVRGDPGDGVPNILSDEDTFMDEKKRQKAMKATDVDKWRVHGLNNPEMFCKDAKMMERFEQNRKVIDFRMIPDDLANKIVEAYNAAEPVRGKMHTYLTGNRLTKIMIAGGW